MPQIDVQDFKTSKIISINYEEGYTIRHLKAILESLGYKPDMKLYYYDDNRLEKELLNVVDISNLNEPGKPLVVVGDMKSAPAPAPEPEPERPPQMAGKMVPVSIEVLAGKRIIDKRYLELTLKLSDTVGDVKDMIEADEGIAVNKQHLVSNGKELKPDTKKLREFGFELNKLKNTKGLIKLIIDVSSAAAAPVPAPAPEMPSAPVPVETRGTSDGVEVTLKINGNPSINKVVLSLKLSDTVGQVKDMIQRITGIPVDEQKLIFRGRPLIQDDKTFGEYLIYKEELHTITVNQETKEHRIDTLLTLMVELPKRQASEMEELQQRQAEEIEQLRQRHARKIEELEKKHAEEKGELPQRQAELEHLMQGLTGGGNRVRRRRNSRKTKRTRKRRSLKKRSRKRRSRKRRSRK